MPCSFDYTSKHGWHHICLPVFRFSDFYLALARPPTAMACHPASIIFAGQIIVLSRSRTWSCSPSCSSCFSHLDVVAQPLAGPRKWTGKNTSCAGMSRQSQPELAENNIPQWTELTITQLQPGWARCRCWFHALLEKEIKTYTKSAYAVELMHVQRGSDKCCQPGASYSLQKATQRANLMPGKPTQIPYKEAVTGTTTCTSTFTNTLDDPPPPPHPPHTPTHTNHCTPILFLLPHPQVNIQSRVMQPSCGGVPGSLWITYPRMQAIVKA